MTYRDEVEALHTRIEAMELELREREQELLARATADADEGQRLRKRIAALERERDQAHTQAREHSSNGPLSHAPDSCPICRRGSGRAPHDAARSLFVAGSPDSIRAEIHAPTAVALACGVVLSAIGTIAAFVGARGFPFLIIPGVAWLGIALARIVRRWRRRLPHSSESRPPEQGGQ